MEIHNQFTYQKGQVFDFTGDDDVWVFIDKKLCLDLGGPHPPMSGSIELDNLGLTEGWVYAFDMFYCERHRDGSSLKFSTSIELSPCGKEDSDKDSTADLCDYCPFGDPELSLTESGSGLTRAFYLTLGTEVRDGLELSFDFGDGKTTEVYTAIDTTIVHSYEKAGTYEVTVSSAPLAGCASSIDTLTVTLTSEGTRIAPKCSSLPSINGFNRRKYLVRALNCLLVEKKIMIRMVQLTFVIIVLLGILNSNWRKLVLDLLGLFRYILAQM
jgi:fibro-slime domain-containing protein